MAADDVTIAIGAKDNASSVLNSLSAKVGTFSSSFAAAGPVIAGVTAAVAAAAGAFVTLQTVVSGVTESANKIDALSDVANGLGESVGDLQQFQFALEEAGNVSAEKSIDTLRKLQRIVGEIASGGNAAGLELFKQLGIDAEALSLQGPIAQYEAIQSAIQSVENSSERAAVAQKLLGKSAAELLPAFTASAESMRESEEFAKRVGAAVSDTEAGAIAAMNDSVGRLGLAFEGIYTTIAVSIAPVVTEVLDVTIEWVIAAKELADQVLPAVVDGMVYIADSAIDLAEAIGIVSEQEQTFAQRVEAVRQAARLRADEMEAQRAQMASINAEASKDELDAAKQQQQQYERTIAALERRFAVAQMSEEFVRSEEELATARNETERQRIEILQQQLFKQEELNRLAEERGRAEELAQKEQQDLQQKIADFRPGTQAVESRLLTRGPASGEQLQKEMLQVAKQANEKAAQTNSLLERANEYLYEQAKKQSVYLEPVQ